MFSTGHTAAGATRLTVARAAYRAFDEHSPLAKEPALHGYLSDMTRPFGVPLREDLIAAGAGHSHGDMAEPLIEALDDGEPVDLLILERLCVWWRVHTGAAARRRTGDIALFAR
jgi:hypothetical protein